MIEINEILPVHVGSEVKLAGWRTFEKIAAVYKEKFCLEICEVYYCKDKWILKDLIIPKNPPMPKKPSERIKDLMESIIFEVSRKDSRLEMSPDYANKRIDAILKLLDENFEKENK